MVVGLEKTLHSFAGIMISQLSVLLLQLFCIGWIGSKFGMITNERHVNFPGNFKVLGLSLIV